MDHQVVSREDWLAARKTHLEAEKALTRQRDKLLEARRALPWVKVEKDYVFEGPDGPVTLGDLFAGRSQLFVQPFMLGPDWRSAEHPSELQSLMSNSYAGLCLKKNNQNYQPYKTHTVYIHTILR